MVYAFVYIHVDASLTVNPEISVGVIFFIWGGLQESNLLTSGHSRLPKPSGSNHHIGGQWENRTHSSHMTSVLQTDSPTLTN